VESLLSASKHHSLKWFKLEVCLYPGKAGSGGTSGGVSARPLYLDPAASLTKQVILKEMQGIISVSCTGLKTRWSGGGKMNGKGLGLRSM
jgi:hypothetical protein